jgi:hypothetical protein
MRPIAFLVAVMAAATTASAQPDLDEVEIGPAVLAISPTRFQPESSVTVRATFRQGLALTPIDGLGCFDPGATSSRACDGTRTLKITLWHDAANGIRAARDSGDVRIEFKPPAFFTRVDQTFAPLRAPRVSPNDYLTIELIFVDKGVEVEGGIRLIEKEFPRVLGFRRYKLTCRPPRRGTPESCSYVDVTQ